MSRQKKTGNKGEEIAQEYLRTLGYEIIETNWRSCYYEIGFIARDKDGLVIIEVKARGSDTYEHPSEAVSDKKIRFLINVAEAYFFEPDSYLDTRFDVMTIIFYGQNLELEHFKDAFYPTA